MGRDQIIQWAREAGFADLWLSAGESPSGPAPALMVERFAALVRSAALEEAAAACDRLYLADPEDCAIAIRALKLGQPQQPESGDFATPVPTSPPTAQPPEHTPGPLRVTSDADDWGASHEGNGCTSYCGIRDADGKVVALAVAHDPGYWSNPDCRSIAERIVQCVNAHDGLVEALRDVIGWIPGRAAWHTDAPMKAVDKARATIAKATGGGVVEADSGPHGKNQPESVSESVSIPSTLSLKEDKRDSKESGNAI